ncbi:hypothetical protein JW898_03435 [Candidatus Woesearchaeota archaeon]|nr:hypothetical protein [Candidatus Woesearchaeota archaeon]
MALEAFLATTTGMIVLLLILAWELVWKGIALWKSARHSQMAWFVCILIFNTIGILPIAYVLFFQKTPIIKRSKKK